MQNCHTSAELLREMCKTYAERPMYGFCEPGSSQWQTITYKQAYQRVEHLAAGAWAASPAHIVSLLRHLTNLESSSFCTHLHII